MVNAYRQDWNKRGGHWAITRNGVEGESPTTSGPLEAIRAAT